MKISLVRPARSISKFVETDIPNFTVLTGLNGAGKTHLLRNIEEGHITISNILPEDIHYHDATSYRIAKPKEMTAQQIQTETDSAWSFLSGQTIQRNSNWLSESQAIYFEVFGEETESVKVDWRRDQNDQEENEKIREYKQRVSNKIFEDKNFRKFPQYQSLISAVCKIQEPIHKIEREKFDEFYAPTIQGNDIFSSSLSVHFTSYKVKQNQWAHRQFDRGLSKTKNELLEEFSANRTPPWEIVNKALESIHSFGGTDSVFDFQITTPPNEALKYNDDQNYLFSPQLVDRAGQTRSFMDLSSGEQTLLALSISIFQASDSLQLPKLLLLDEIDSSLHPSMSKALLGAIQKVFVDAGTHVILATHSPSTVAQAPDNSVHVISKLDGHLSITRETRGNAIQTLSEGFISISDSNISMLSVVPENKIAILTEGDNSKILKNFLKLRNINDVEVVEGAEDRTGDSDIKNYYSLFSKIGSAGKILCVWDCDCVKKFGNLGDVKNLFTYVIPHNPNNELTDKGIENAFPEAAFNGFKVERRPDDGSEATSVFNTRKKSEFANAMANSKEANWFSHFNGLVEKIDQIRKA